MKVPTSATSNTDPIAAFLDGGEVVGCDGDHHALLRLGEPHLPRVEAGVLAGHEVEVDVGADPLGHLADRRRQPTGAAVGDRRVQVLGADQGVDQELLDDRVADLHARAGDLAGGGVHRGRRERGAADAVAPGGASEHDHTVAGERAVVDRSARRRADAAGEHEWVGGVGRVVEDRAGDRGQADLVAVVGDAVDHAVADAPRVQRAVGEVGEGEVGSGRNTRCR